MLPASLNFMYILSHIYSVKKVVLLCPFLATCLLLKPNVACTDLLYSSHSGRRAKATRKERVELCKYHIKAFGALMPMVLGKGAT